jgi:hypothetical protein
MYLKHLTLPGQKKFRTQPTVGKAMLKILEDAPGPILEHLHNKGAAVNSVHYSEMLWDLLKPGSYSNPMMRTVVGNCHRDSGQWLSKYCHLQLLKTSSS